MLRLFNPGLKSAHLPGHEFPDEEVGARNNVGVGLQKAHLVDGGPTAGSDRPHRTRCTQLTLQNLGQLVRLVVSVAAHDDAVAEQQDVGALAGLPGPVTAHASVIERPPVGAKEGSGLVAVGHVAETVAAQIGRKVNNAGKADHGFDQQQQTGKRRGSESPAQRIHASNSIIRRPNSVLRIA